MGMTGYIARRIVQMLFVLVVISIVTFLIMRVLPGDPVSVIVGFGPVSEETVQSMRRQMGLDQPLYIQYVIYMRDVFRGDLGIATHTGRPVVDDLLQRLPASAELALYSLLLGLLIGVPLGVISAVRRNGIFDRLTRVFTVSGVSVPAFWLGIVLIYFFYYRLGWTPAPMGRVSQHFHQQTAITGFVTVDAALTRNVGMFSSAISHMLLPMAVLSYESLAYITRMTRTSMLEVLSKQYITVSRAKGLSEPAIMIRHALRNALIPLFTVVAPQQGRRQ